MLKKAALYLIWIAVEFKKYAGYYLGRLGAPDISAIKKKIDSDLLYADMGREERQVWEKRIQDVVDCPDNQFIPRVKNAGSIAGDRLIMHNGLKIDPRSYYGNAILKMLIENKGVHEPQEERVFDAVLKTIPENSVMLELGSYWAFYSMWFYSRVPGAKCYMIEPELSHLKFGEKNFRINGMKGSFNHAYISNRSFISANGERFIGVDDFIEKNKIDFVDILHSDIQGFEFNMLKGAVKLFESRSVGYVFISTHSNSIHQECLRFLESYGFVIVAEADLDCSFSMDGLIVAKDPNYKGIEKLEISKRNTKINQSENA